MRRLEKATCPDILERNGDQWLKECLEDPNNPTKRYRYRHLSIKRQLKEETHGKCVYCESKIGHNTPGDTEHIRPVAKFAHDIFRWENMTVACTECNRRKGDYYDKKHALIDPYSDEVEEMIVHLGPLVTWAVGNRRAEITIRILELSSSARMGLIGRKIEKLEEAKNLMERIESTESGTLRELLELRLEELTSVGAEFSGMVAATVRALRSR